MTVDNPTSDARKGKDLAPRGVLDVNLSSYDSDGCGRRPHTYDDNCNWRSKDERDAFPKVALGVHSAIEYEPGMCQHDTHGSTCADVAMAAIDALYENGWKVARG